MKFQLGAAEFTGDTLDAPLMVKAFEPGGPSVDTSDSPRSNRSGVMLGRDFLREATWAFSISARGGGIQEVLEANAVLAREWLSKSRSLPGVTVPLKYHTAGRWRRVYGRPSRYQGPTPDFIAEGGIGFVECDFRVTDLRHYSEDAQSVTLTIVPATTGGLMAPLVAPLSTVRSSAPRAGQVTNQGDAPSPLSVTFYGPVTDPWVRTTSGMEVALVGSLAYDETVVVDAQAGTVTRGATLVNGMTTRKTRLSSTEVPPGPTDFTFGGIDPTGTAKAKLSWRDAFVSL